MKIVTIDDAMSVFDDFTCGDLDVEGAIILRDMLEEKAIPSEEYKAIKIQAIDDMGKPLVGDKTKYLLDNRRMQIYQLWADVEMLNPLHLTYEIVEGAQQ